MYIKNKKEDIDIDRCQYICMLRLTQTQRGIETHVFNTVGGNIYMYVCICIYTIEIEIDINIDMCICMYNI